MVIGSDDSQPSAVRLHEDSVGVSVEKTARRVQNNGSENQFYITQNAEWLRQLNLGEQGARTLHSVSVGIRPVVVRHPAIIIQPAVVLEESDFGD